ncbi:MAG: hypothetical protein JNM40_02675 [Myxococcales bacterium]|nr:hypothetical protein [Myxococcales bacterium]
MSSLLASRDHCELLRTEALAKTDANSDLSSDSYSLSYSFSYSFLVRSTLGILGSGL